MTQYQRPPGPSIRQAVRPPQPELQPWPVLEDEALYGPIGDFVTAVAPHTEADPAALLLNALAYAGCLLGDACDVALMLGGRPHRPCLFVAIIGKTAKARKGTSSHVLRSVADAVDPMFDLRALSGFGSGEALILALTARGAEGKGVVLEEEELASVLKTCSRDGSTLGQIIRKSWDGSTLQRRTVKSATVVSGYRLSVIGHGTWQELTRLLTDADVFGGTVNRFLWCCAKRSGLHSSGGNPPRSAITTLAEQIDSAVSELADQSIQTGVGQLRVRFSTEAAAAWVGIYASLGQDDPPGLLGHALARSESQVLRVALVLALMDQSVIIEVAHLTAALAVWRYCRSSAAYIFGTASGDRRNDQILAAIRAAGADGISQLDVRRSLGTHDLDAGEMERRLNELASLGLLSARRVPTNGRPVTVWNACSGPLLPLVPFLPAGVSHTPSVSVREGVTGSKGRKGNKPADQEERIEAPAALSGSNSEDELSDGVASPLRRTPSKRARRPVTDEDDDEDALPTRSARQHR
jgi:Protein of unknown function (DUF3987)